MPNGKSRVRSQVTVTARIAAVRVASAVRRVTKRALEFPGRLVLAVLALAALIRIDHWIQNLKVGCLGRRQEASDLFIFDGHDGLPRNSPGLPAGFARLTTCRP